MYMYMYLSLSLYSACSIALPPISANKRFTPADPSTALEASVRVRLSWLLGRHRDRGLRHRKKQRARGGRPRSETTGRCNGPGATTRIRSSPRRHLAAELVDGAGAVAVAEAEAPEDAGDQDEVAPVHELRELGGGARGSRALGGVLRLPPPTLGRTAVRSLRPPRQTRARSLPALPNSTGCETHELYGGLRRGARPTNSTGPGRSFAISIVCVRARSHVSASGREIRHPSETTAFRTDGAEVGVEPTSGSTI